MNKLPEGVVPRTSLAAIQNIASPGAIRTFLIVARKRVTARRETRRGRFKEKNPGYACITYFTAAELAAALVSFDVATKGKYSQHLGGMRKELVLCLGNTAEMALRIEQYDRALYFAVCAVEGAHDLSTEGGLDAVDDSIKEKNQRRVERARFGLSLLSSSDLARATFELHLRE